jgi:hypothetical protein
MVGVKSMKSIIKKLVRFYRLKKAKKKESNIFNPKSKIIANVDRAIEHIKTGYTTPVLIEVDRLTYTLKSTKVRKHSLEQ